MQGSGEGIQAALNANMEQLNKKRTNLKQSETILNENISHKEAMLAEISQNLTALNAKEQELRDRLQKSLVMVKDFDQFIIETDNSYQKIEESVKTLLFVVKKGSENLSRKKDSAQGQTHAQ